MASWTTESTGSTFNANAQIKNQTDGRNRNNNGNGGRGYQTLNASDYEYKENMTDSKWGWDHHDESFYGDYTDEPEAFNFFGEAKTTGYSIVGIDGNQVPAMREQIEVYVQEVQNYLEDAIQATREQIATAFRGGEAEKAVDQYLEKEKNYVHNVVSTLNAFSDKLADVGNAWVKAQSSIASNVNTSTGAFSEGSSYVADMQYSGPSR